MCIYNINKYVTIKFRLQYIHVYKTSDIWKWEERKEKIAFKWERIGKGQGNG